MRRGDIWTVAGGGDYIGRPRPAVVVQVDEALDIDSVTLCPMTTTPAESLALRIAVRPDGLNGLDAPSWIMPDKVTTMRQYRLGERIGRLGGADIARLDLALRAFLGLGARA